MISLDQIATTALVSAFILVKNIKGNKRQDLWHYLEVLHLQNKIEAKF